MILKVIGSGSSGNCCVLESNTEALIIEAGVPFFEVKKALDFNTRKIVGVVVGHSHKDHSGYAEQYSGICPIYKPYEVITQNERFGNFFIKAFPLVHDVECYGFFITHPEIGSMIYASDTEYIKYRFNGLNHILVECNYNKSLIPNDAINRSHVMRGHMELQTTLGFLEVNNNPALRTVVLIHLSKNNGDPVKFEKEARKIVQCPVYIAEYGLEVDLNLVPF